MPVIQFDVLISTGAAEELGERFSSAVDKLVAADKITDGQVQIISHPTLLEGVEDALRQSFRDEHDDADLEDSSVVRYLIEVEGVTGSVNQLAMALSRFMTPQADLPRDAVLLENETVHEVPATYPWSVEIRR
ncbi:hypothetical protein [Corynebacterium alimapuense]|uniref:Uncharacterized protein n=1 Tax=Corynebacterium alimapuense TaxID=1576874 RepID=A0A3M8K892_9CORY|nr:hypothetical protein [Corynebacterium alimapuense]RNE49443.1 hypothetical protein C5L39_03520 [Corynebacterium alimapuense]